MFKLLLGGEDDGFADIGNIRRVSSPPFEGLLPRDE
jgi:hypothetical protein